MTFQPSTYQKAVYDQLKNGSGNIGVNAVAGSGKTTTTVEALKLLPYEMRQGAGFIAFNKIIADTLDKKINGATKGFNSVTCKTTHALGYDALRRNLADVQKWNVNQFKYPDMAKELSGLAEYGDEKSLKDAAGALTRFSQLSMTEPTPENILELATLYNVEIPAGGEKAISLAVHAMLERGLERAKQGDIGFEDMLWAPMKLGFKPLQFDLLAVDEAQDLNAAQMMLAGAAVKPGGRVLYVGDPKQAIYMFAGALSDSFDRLTAHFNAEVLPLSICYRCPTSVIELAKLIVPQIEAAPNAQAGTVERINDARMNDLLRDGDMVLCRLTAPLISQCFALISRGVTARVRGRDIGKQLAVVIKNVAKRGSFADFTQYLHEYERAQIASLMQKPNSEAAQDAVRDKCECLSTCYNYFTPKSASEFARKVEELFSDDKEGVILSTIHRAKGLEANRVFIIKPDKLPLVWKGQSEAQYAQEKNLEYVAYTRAMSELYIVDGTVSGFATTTQPEPAAEEETPSQDEPGAQGSLFTADGEVDRDEMARAVWSTLLSMGVTLYTNGPGRLRAEFSRQEGLNSLDREAIEDYAPELWRLAAITEEADHLINEYFDFPTAPETSPSPTEGDVSPEGEINLRFTRSDISAARDVHNRIALLLGEDQQSPAAMFYPDANASEAAQDTFAHIENEAAATLAACGPFLGSGIDILPNPEDTADDPNAPTILAAPEDEEEEDDFRDPFEEEDDDDEEEDQDDAWERQYAERQRRSRLTSDQIFTD